MKSLREYMLDERRQDALTILTMIKNNAEVLTSSGAVKLGNFQGLMSYLMSEHGLERIGEGIYSIAYKSGKTEFEVALKVTARKKMAGSAPDGWHKYAELSKTAHESNSYFPKVYDFFYLPEKEGETVEEDGGYQVGFVEALKTFDYSDPAYDEIALALGMIGMRLKEGVSYKVIKDRVKKILDSGELASYAKYVDTDQLLDWFKRTSKINEYQIWDLHGGNFGTRKSDNTFVIFDPMV